MRAIFYIDSERLAGHALTASAALMAHMPDLEMTFWVYGTTDKAALAKHNIGFKQFLPQTLPFDGVILNSDGTQSTVEMEHKSYRVQTIGDMVRNGLSDTKRNGSIGKRALVTSSVLLGLLIILIYQLSYRAAKGLGFAFGLIARMLKQVYTFAARTLQWGLKGITYFFSAIVHGVQRLMILGLRAMIRFAQFMGKLVRVFRLLGRGLRMLVTDFSHVMRMAARSAIYGLKLTAFAPVLLLMSLFRGGIGAAELSVRGGRRLSRAVSSRGAQAADNLSRYADKTRHTLAKSRTFAPLYFILKYTNRILSILVAGILFVNRGLSGLLENVAGFFGRSARAGRRMSNAIRTRQERIIKPSKKPKRKIHNLRKAKKPKRPSGFVRKLNELHHTLPKKFNAATARFHKKKNAASFAFVQKRDTAIYRARVKFLTERNKAKFAITTFINKLPPNDYIAFIRAHNHGFDRMIFTSKPDIVFLLENNVETTTHFLTTRLKNSGIKSVVVPFTIPNPDEPAQFYKTDKLRLIRGPVSTFIAMIFPQWRYDYEGKKMLRMAKSKVLTFEALGLSMPMPWYLNSGPVDKVFVESPAMQELYERLNFPAEQLACVGDVVDETLRSVKSDRVDILDRFIKTHDLRPGLPIILCAFPPNQYGDKNDGFEYESFEALIRGWAGMLNTLSEVANVIIRPHPRVNPDILAQYCNDQIVVSAAPTAELVPLCDIYLACISATIRWALSLGIPVINYDCYRYRYDDFDTSRATLYVDNLQDCSQTLHRLIKDFGAFEALEKLAQSDSVRWGQQNGTFGSNMAETIRAL